MGGGVVAAGSTFSTWNILFSGNIKEVMQTSTVNGSTVYLGINQSGPGHTLDIVNVYAGCNAINVRNAVNPHTIFAVNDAGNTGISGI